MGYRRCLAGTGLPPLLLCSNVEGKLRLALL